MINTTRQRTRINRDIRVTEVRLIDDNGDQLGVLDTRDALAKAQDAGLDLVEVSPHAKPPVCKIMDFGKHKYELSKKSGNEKKKQVKVHLKEIKFRPGTEEGDFNTKLNKILAFLEKGDKVKVTIRFRGREMMFQHLAVELMDRLKEAVSEAATIEQEPKLEGRQMIMMLGTKRK